MSMFGLLTKRELDCLRLAACDKSMQQTTDILCRSIKSVRSHRKFSLNKIDFQSITEAVVSALKMDYLNLD